LLRHQNPKIDELAKLGAREDDASLTPNRVARVCGRPPIEELKHVEETSRDLERIEFAVRPQGNTVWRSLNHFIATKTEDRGNPMFGQWTVRSAYGCGLDPDRRSTDLQHIVPLERVNQARGLDEKLSLSSGPFAPQLAMQLGIWQAVQCMRVEWLLGLIGGGKRCQHTVVMDEGEHAPARQVAFDSTKQLAHRRPERLPSRTVLVFAEPRGARRFPMPPDTTSPAIGNVVRAPQSLRSPKEVLCVAVEQVVRNRDSQTERRHGDAGADAPINRDPAFREVVALVGHDPSYKKVRDAGQVRAALDRTVEKRPSAGRLTVRRTHRASIAGGVRFTRQWVGEPVTDPSGEQRWQKPGIDRSGLS